VSQKAKTGKGAAGNQEPPARARVDAGSPDPEDIRDKLLRTIDLRADKLLSLAEHSEESGVIGWTEDDPPRPIQFPAYEVQAYANVVNAVNEAEIRQLRELGKMPPAELEAAVVARERLWKAKRGGA
jgi:hypothetical protein